jgi:hypothetical protein
MPTKNYPVIMLQNNPVAVLVDLTLASCVIVEWYMRYRLPVELTLTAFAAVGYARFWEAFCAKRQSQGKNL